MQAALRGPGTGAIMQSQPKKAEATMAAMARSSRCTSGKSHLPRGALAAPQREVLAAGGAAAGGRRAAVVVAKDKERLGPRVLRREGVLGWPKRCKLAHAFRWEYSYERLKLAQLLDKLGVFLTFAFSAPVMFPSASSRQASMPAKMFRGAWSKEYGSL